MKPVRSYYAGREARSGCPIRMTRHRTESRMPFHRSLLTIRRRSPRPASSRASDRAARGVLGPRGAWRWRASSGPPRGCSSFVSVTAQTGAHDRSWLLVSARRKRHERKQTEQLWMRRTFGARDLGAGRLQSRFCSGGPARRAVSRVMRARQNRGGAPPATSADLIAPGDSGCLESAVVIIVLMDPASKKGILPCT